MCDCTCTHARVSQWTRKRRVDENLWSGRVSLMLALGFFTPEEDGQGLSHQTQFVTLSGKSRLILP